MFYHNLKEEQIDILPLTDLQMDIFTAVKMKKCDYLETNKVFFRNKVDESILRKVVGKIVCEQQALRVVFRMAGAKGPVQILLKNIILPIYLSKDNAPMPTIEEEPWNIVLLNEENSIELRYCHIVMDGWGMSVFWKEILKGYCALLESKTFHPSKGISLRSYYECRNEEYFPESENEVINKYLWSNSSVIADYLYSIRTETEEENYIYLLPEGLTGKITLLSSTLNVTSTTIFYLAWAILIGAITKQDDVCFGVILSGRNAVKNITDAIGMFIQKIPMCIHISDDMEDMCRQIKGYLYSDIVTSQYAGMHIEKWVKDNNYKIEYDTLVTVENYPLEERMLLDETSPAYGYEYYERPSNDFTLQVRVGKKVEVSLSSGNPKYFCHLKNLLNLYIHLLEQIAEQNRKTSELLLCKNKVDTHEKNVKQPYETITDAIRAAGNKYDERIAIVDGNDKITYRELYYISLTGAQNLARLGIRKGDSVGVCMNRSMKELIAVYSIILAGGVYVPFTNIPSERANYMIAQADVCMMIVDCTEVEYGCKCISYEELTEECDKTFTPQNSFDDTAYILFTSGSTGDPKGCIISHGAIVNRLCWNARELKLGFETRQLFKTPTTFDVSLVEIFSIFFAGHTLYILPEGQERIPEKILDNISKNKINYIHFVPSMLWSLFEYMQEFNEFAKFETVELLVCSGEILPSDLVKNIHDANNKIQIVNLYGPTEAAVDVSYYFCEEEIPTVQTPIGKAIDNTALVVVDHKQRILPCGIGGEIYILGRNLGKGYIGQPELTNKYFIHMKDGRVAYRTGDYGYLLEDGNFVVLGREDDQVKYNGVRIELSEIEHIMIQSGLVSQAAVVLQKQEANKLIAFYVAKQECGEKLKKYMEDFLPTIMMPHEFVKVDELVVSKHGKIDKRALLSDYNSDKKNIVTTVNEELTDTEKILSVIWNKVLNTNCRYSANDNFFACGGNSLKLIKVIIEIKKQLNVIISTPIIYDNPTLAFMAKKVEQAKEAANIPHKIPQLGFGAKKKIALFQLNNPDSTAYNMPILMHLSDELQIDDAERSLIKVLNYYEWLHKCYNYDGRQLVERIEKRDITSIERIYCSEEELNEKCKEFVTPFVIEERLFRVKTIICGRGAYILMDFHHLLLDQSVIEFLLVAWGNAIEKIALPQSVVCDEIEHAEEVGNVVPNSSHENERVLDNISPLYKNKVGKLKRYEFTYDENTENEINLLCKEYRCSKFQILLSAFSILCRKISGKSKFSIGTNTTGDVIASQTMSLITLPINICLEDTFSIQQLVQNISQELVYKMKEADRTPAINYDVMFVREEDVFKDRKIAKYISSVKKINKDTKCPLTLFYIEREDETKFYFDYDEGFFEEGAVASFSESYNCILISFADKTIRNIAECRTVGEQTQKRINSFSKGEIVNYRTKELQEYFVEKCIEKPGEVVLYEGAREITRKELLDLAQNVAFEISSRVECDSIIGVLMPLGINYIATIAGILMAGCAFMPLDSKQPIKRNEQILRESNAPMCVVDDQCEIIESDGILLNFNSLNKAKNFQIRHSEKAYCIFTSGSTGKPKGCMISQKNAENYLLWANKIYCENKKQTFALFSSPAVDMSITSILVPLLFGHKIILYPQEAGSIINIVKDRRITVLKATPSHIKLLEKIDELSSVKCLIVGGEQFDISLVKKIQECFNKDVKIYNEYGPTEATVACMIYQYSARDSFSVVPIGRAIQNMIVTVRDKKGDLSLPGTLGEIVIEGRGVIAGYINNPELTQKSFGKNKNGKWCYKTGDIARLLENGDLLYEGRRDDQYKLSGYRVELAEISTAAQEIEGVKWAHVLNDGKRLLLFCKLEDDCIMSEVELRKELFERIPRYMMPSQIFIVSEIALKENGKIDEMYLKTFFQKKDDVDRVGDIHDFIRHCWEEELNIVDFSDTDGFLEIGGNSISIVALHKKISVRFPDITIADLFCYPSVSTLTDYLTTKTEEMKLVEKLNEKTDDKAAIVGLGFRLPGANDLDSLRAVLMKSSSSVRILNGQRAEDERNRLENMGWKSEDYRFSMVASLESIDQFDYDYFHIGKDEAIAMDPAHKLLLSVIDDALENAGISKEHIKGHNCAVIIAAPTDIGFSDYVKSAYPTLAKVAPLNDVSSSIAGRVSFIYDLHGPAYLLDSACSSGLLAMDLANSLINDGSCDMAIVAGANLVDTVDYWGMEHAKVLSASYHANSFSSEADGTARGEGAICYIVENLKNARKENRGLYAIIEGSASNNDGFSSSLTAPNGRMQELVIKQAWFNAGVSLEDVSLIETHGTATPLGDEIELQSLSKVIREAGIGQCAISASKSVFGHLDTVAGLLGILKCIMSMTYGELYPIVGMVKPAGGEQVIGSPFYFPDRVMEWGHSEKARYFCGVNCFGLSGTNVHMVLSNVPRNKVITKYKSRLKPQRCWLPDKAEVFVNSKYVQQQEKKIVYYNESEIIRILLEKVNSLFSDSVAAVNIPLYQSGFDSISVIQLKLFIRNKFGIDIEVSSRDTIKSLAKQIAKENYREPIKTEAADMTLPVPEAATTTNWYDFQVRNSLLKFQDEYVCKTRKSYELLKNTNLTWANGRFMTGYTKGLEIFSYPIIFERGEGAIVWDIDKNEYIDFSMGFGANLFGYKNLYISEKVNQSIANGFVLGPLMKEPFGLAERISKLTGLERVSFCNSGTESIMNLIRIARAATGKEKIAVFDGSFHGTFDPVYVQKYEEGNSYIPLPRSEGTPLHYVKDVIMLNYGDNEALKYIEEQGGELAAVLVEPIQSRHPDLRPREFVKNLREVTERKGILLLFDEVINGFRNGLGGAQAYYGIKADLVAYGKVIGGGYPIGVFGGKAKYLDLIDHRGGLTDAGNVRQWVSTGGTFNGHPASVAAGCAVLDILEKEGEELYSHINAMTDMIATQLNSFFEMNHFEFVVEHYGSQFIITGGNPIELRLMQYLLINEGIYVWEGGTCFVSTAHSWEHIHKFIDTTKFCALKTRELLPQNDGINVFVDPQISPKDYFSVKKLVNKYSNIREVSVLEDNLLSVLTYNVINHGNHMDYSMLHIMVAKRVEEQKIEESLDRVVNSHRHLCSGVSWRRVKQPIRIVYENVKCPVEIHHCKKNEKKRLISEVIELRRKNGFNIEQAPLIFFDFFIGDETDIILSYYNSWFDGWSADEFLKEICEALFDDVYPEQSMDWNEYLDWKEENNEKAEKYWSDKKLIFDKITFKPVLGGGFYKVRRSFPEDLKGKIKLYCQKNQISSSSLYLSVMAEVMKTKYIMTSISGRGCTISGIMNEVGLFSGILPIAAGSPKEMNAELEILNSIPIISYEKIAQLTGSTVEEISDFSRYFTIIILNQQSHNNQIANIVEDETYVHVPLRSYILPEQEVLITANNDTVTYEAAVELAEKYISLLEKIIRVDEA